MGSNAAEVVIVGEPLVKLPLCVKAYVWEASPGLLLLVVFKYAEGAGSTELGSMVAGSVLLSLLLGYAEIKNGNPGLGTMVADVVLLLSGNVDEGETGAEVALAVVVLAYTSEAEAKPLTLLLMGSSALESAVMLATVGVTVTVTGGGVTVTVTAEAVTVTVIAGAVTVTGVGVTVT